MNFISGSEQTLSTNKKKETFEWLEQICWIYEKWSLAERNEKHILIIDFDCSKQKVEEKFNPVYTQKKKKIRWENVIFFCD